MGVCGKEDCKGVESLAPFGGPRGGGISVRRQGLFLVVVEEKQYTPAKSDCTLSNELYSR